MMSRGKSQKSVDLVEAAADILEEIQPASVRAVCYRLFVAGAIPSMSKANTSKVSRNLVWAREQGIIPWEHIVDETREAERITTWDDPEQLIQAAVRQYRKDYWKDQAEWVEVWSEKGTVRGSISSVLDEYGITFRVMHGYTSATAIQSVARESALGEKPLTVLYVGDWDPSGLHMSEVDLPERLRRYGGHADIHRIALMNFDTQGLPGFEAATKKNDPRYKWFVSNYGTRCWELDALPPPDLRRRVEGSIQELIDWAPWKRDIAVEQAETKSMQEFLQSWQSISGQVQK